MSEKPRIQYLTRRDLIVAYSDDLPGLLVTGRSKAEVDSRLPAAIKEIEEAYEQRAPTP